MKKSYYFGNDHYECREYSSEELDEINAQLFAPGYSDGDDWIPDDAEFIGSTGCGCYSLR